MPSGLFYDATLFFASGDNEGWSETYCITDVSPDAVATTLRTLAEKRQAMMPDWFAVTGGRVSRIDILGDSYPIDESGFPLIGTYATDVVGPVEANTAVKVRLLGTAPHRNLKYMRGLDLSVVTGRHFLGPDAWMSVFDDYNGVVAAPTFGFQVVYTDDLGAVQREPVTNCVIAGASARKPGRPFGAPRGRKFAHRSPALASAAKQSIGSAPVTKPKRG